MCVCVCVCVCARARACIHTEGYNKFSTINRTAETKFGVIRASRSIHDQTMWKVRSLGQLKNVRGKNGEARPQSLQTMQMYKAVARCCCRKCF